MSDLGVSAGTVRCAKCGGDATVSLFEDAHGLTMFAHCHGMSGKQTVALNSLLYGERRRAAIRQLIAEFLDLASRLPDNELAVMARGARAWTDREPRYWLSTGPTGDGFAHPSDEPVE